MKIRSRLLTKTLAWLASTAARALFATCKTVLIEGTEVSVTNNPDAPRRYLYCIWHDSLLIPIFAVGSQHMCCLVSRHQDGSYLADALEVIGMKPVRGSTSRGGAAALKQLISDTKEYHISITPDGPRGPRRQLKQGIVYLASKLNREILPTAFACDRYWKPKGSWTDLLIPKPFSTVYALGAPPFSVPHDATKAEIKQKMAELQTIMDNLANEVEQIAKNGGVMTAKNDDKESIAA